MGAPGTFILQPLRARIRRQLCAGRSETPTVRGPDSGGSCQGVKLSRLAAGYNLAKADGRFHIKLTILSPVRLGRLRPASQGEFRGAP